MDAVESDIAKSKAIIRRIREALTRIDECHQRLAEAAAAEAVRFAGLDSQSVLALLDKLRDSTKDDLTETASLDAIAGGVERLADDYGHVESLLSRLNEAYGQIKRLVQERPTWNPLPSSV